MFLMMMSFWGIDAAGAIRRETDGIIECEAHAPGFRAVGRRAPGSSA